MPPPAAARRPARSVHLRPARFVRLRTAAMCRRATLFALAVLVAPALGANALADGHAGLRLGMARVYILADNRVRVSEMLALERAARAAGRGIWGHPFYAVRTPAEVGRNLNSFQLVEGRVLDAARVRTRVYLNFGPDWRTDFMVTLDAGARRLFRDAGFDPLALEGRRVRVRGWLREFNGLLIDTTHPEQIKVLGP